MGTFTDLQAIFAAAEPFKPVDGVAAPLAISQPSANGHAAPADAHPLANEADNDPHRLARVFLDSHKNRLRYWREEWWQYSHGHYQRFGKGEMLAKINRSVKAEFDRLNVAALESPDKANSDGKMPEAHKVTRTLVNNVLGAIESICILSADQNLQEWIVEELPSSSLPSNNCISLVNGILDLDALLRGESDPSLVLLPHSPAWFSPICLPYSFDLEASCPKWDSFLSHNLEDDEERIDLLQEWAGYLLLPDTAQQKFLFLEGEGSNGKSVYYAAIEAMLGKENVSHVPLESFGGEFTLYSTIGKLANIAADCGELDKTAEGILKSFTSGDRMTFNRKGLPLVDASPTARLMIAANNRPRFSDRSRGLWRRMMVVPFNVTIEDEMKVRGMDKPEWWQASGELPGILNWAIIGLNRLRQNRQFTKSKMGEAALEEYRAEVNPAKAFLIETCRAGGGTVITGALYDFYKWWCKSNGYHPVNERNFGKEVFREFPGTQKHRGGPAIKRSYEYHGLIADEKIDEFKAAHTTF